MLDCNCPGNTALDTIPYNPCKDIFGKDARFVFQRHDDGNNTFVNSTNGIEEESAWTSLPDASDGTKVVVTPRLEDVNFGEPEVLEDSENFDGAPFAVGSGPQLVTAIIRNPTAAQYAALKSLECESDLTFYRISSTGKFGARLVGSTDHAGIVISPDTFVIRDPSKGPGRVDMTKLMIQFYLPSGWFSSFAQVSPEDGFSPLTEIKPS